jgi:hypothetical protein
MKAVVLIAASTIPTLKKPGEQRTQPAVKDLMARWFWNTPHCQKCLQNFKIFS